MYCQFYGMREKPFSLLPDPEFLFFSETHEKALNLLQLGILNQSGFCVISGEIGAGKTTLVRELLNRLDERVRVGLISNTNSTFSDLLGWILAAYELEPGSDLAVSRYSRFTDFVIEQYAGGKHTLLIIDEAQNLSLSALEQLRMLSNINSEKDLVLQIILIGQSELRTKLQQPELEQFAQRIAIDYHLQALNQEETAAYIRHRAIKSGGSQQLFDDAACRLVYQYSNGIPRLINRICDLSLVYGFTESKKIIDADLVEAVTEDQQIDQLITNTPAPPSKSITLPEKLATTRKDAPAPVHPGIRRTTKPTRTGSIEKSADLKPAAKKAVKKTVKATDKETEGQLTHGASSAIYTATEKASAEKARAESIATEISSVASTLVEKSKADTAIAEQAEAENLAAEKEAAEKAAAEKAAAEQAEASMAAAKLAKAEKLAAEKTAKNLSSAAEQAAESSVEKKQTADKLVAEKARVETQVLKEAEAAKTAAEKALAERIAAEKVAAEAAAASAAAARKVTANRVAAEKAAADIASDSEAAAKRALGRQADAERIVAEKAAGDKAASEKARANTELAKRAAAETAAAKSAARAKALAAKQAAQKAAASRAAAEKALAEKEAADTIAVDKASLEKAALAELAVSIAATAQQAADRAAAARAAAQQETSEKEAAAITAARKAAEASALAEKAATESRTPSDPPAATQPQTPATRATQSATTHRRTRVILAFSVVSVVVAASTWLITRSIDTGVLKNPAVAAGQSFADSSPTTEAAALESAIDTPDLQ